MKEIITKIEEVQWEKVNERKYGAGYKITTNKQSILFLIANYQACCEDWGYLTSEDNLEEFIGAELNDIRITDTALKTYDLPKNHGGDYENNVVFLTLETSKGPLQFVAYNYHNGYYGHNVYVRSNQISETILA